MDGWIDTISRWMDGWMDGERERETDRQQMIFTAVGFTPGGSVKVQYIQLNTKQYIHNQKKNTEQ
jgi:hypothetical protein